MNFMQNREENNQNWLLKLKRLSYIRQLIEYIENT